MAESSCLEKMGRELKCPICLSLLKSAASLVCNHVFCNSCISECMKSVSQCPVCKLPFRRREIRAAPHMDNLVSIYRSMEVASGINIFTTQIARPPNSSDVLAENQGIGKQQTTIEVRNKLERRRLSGKKQIELDANVAVGSGLTTRPTFPVKKRVLVTPYPIPETPIQSKKDQKSVTLSTEFHSNNSDKVTENQWLVHEQVEDSLSPFFWLRKADNDDNDESIEKLSGQLTADTSTPQIAPCFSDLKDSDCGTPSKSTPISKPDLIDTFNDSEMFEWTQRPCSPELFYTPLTKMNNSEQKHDILQESSKETKVAIAKKLKLHTPHSENHINQVKRRTCSTNMTDKIVERKLIDLNEISKMHAFPEKEGIKNRTQHRERSRSRHGDCTMVKKLKLKKKGIKINKTAKHSERKCLKTSNIVHSGDACTIFEPGVRNEDDQNLGDGFLAAPSGFQAEDRDEDRNCLASSEMVKHENNLSAANLCNFSEAPSNPRTLNVKKSFGSTKETLLGRCGNKDSDVLCAFCQSNCITEASGEMIHCFNGMLVAADYNGGINIVHAHKNCIEWAPNVYFEDKLAVNLSSELARSKRIKCSSCSLKGAALGCFEKACRKSFHFTCAKSIPECRWDCKNFVMLCPLHSCSKLPCESLSTKTQQIKRYVQQGVSNASITTKAGQERNFASKWPFGSSCKWVICCSGLSEEEKVSVSEFARLTSASISKAWSPLVTHVIASVDENGACRRTLKYLMGILNGKWILTFDWIKACMKTMQPVDEQPYVVNSDVNGSRDGPHLGRLRVINRLPKLFKGFMFYFNGDFKQSYKGYLHDLISAAGGVVLQRKPVSRDQGKLLDCLPSEAIFIIFNDEASEKLCNVEHRRSEAEALARSSGARLVSCACIIDSIAAFNVEPLYQG